MTESGIERNTATVARKLPRKIKIMAAGEEHSDAAFAQHRGNGLLDEHRLIEDHVRLQLRGNVAQGPDGRS